MSEFVNVRETKDVKSKSIQTINTYTKVTILDEESGWYYVELGNEY